MNGREQTYVIIKKENSVYSVLAKGLTYEKALNYLRSQAYDYILNKLAVENFEFSTLRLPHCSFNYTDSFNDLLANYIEFYMAYDDSEGE